MIFSGAVLLYCLSRVWPVPSATSIDLRKHFAVIDVSFACHLSVCVILSHIEIFKLCWILSFVYTHPKIDA